ncbi:hypothetical protein VCR17J2_890048 [Vibrio coralliirubri]|nr:hypothetical protein VCR17J2_890048 [Vibrio coralliirubri]
MVENWRLVQWSSNHFSQSVPVKGATFARGKAYNAVLRSSCGSF